LNNLNHKLTIQS